MKKRQMNSVEMTIASSSLKNILLITIALIAIAIFAHIDALKISDEFKKIISFLPLVWATVLSALLIFKSSK